MDKNQEINNTYKIAKDKNITLLIKKCTKKYKKALKNFAK